MPTPAFISALKSDRCVHYLNGSLVNRAQNIDVNASVPNEVVEELGNQNHAGIVSAPAEVSLSLSVFDTGMDLGRSLTGKPAAASLTLGDFAGARVDYVGVVRDNVGQFFRSVYVKGACINSINLGYDTAGNAVEGYGLSADNLTVFDGYVITKTYTIQAADQTAGYFTLPAEGAENPVQTKTDSYFGGAYLLRVTKKSGETITVLAEGTDYTYTPATKRIAQVVPGSMAEGQEWTVVFYSAAVGTPLNPAFSGTIPAVRGEFTPVSIGVSAKTWIPRLQSANIAVNLQQKRFPQLGSKQVLFAPGGVPAVSGSFSVLMNDLSLRKLLTYGDAGSAETQFGIEQMPAYGAHHDLGLEAVVKSPADNSVLKRITVPDIVVATGGMPANINGTLTEAFTWTGRTGALTIANS